MTSRGAAWVQVHSSPTLCWQTPSPRWVFVFLHLRVQSRMYSQNHYYYQTHSLVFPSNEKGTTSHENQINNIT